MWVVTMKNRTHIYPYSKDLQWDMYKTNITMTTIHFCVIWVPKKCSDKEPWGFVSVSRDYVELEDQKDFMDELMFEMTLGRVAGNEDEGEENASLKPTLCLKSSEQNALASDHILTLQR